MKTDMSVSVETNSASPSKRVFPKRVMKELDGGS